MEVVNLDQKISDEALDNPVRARRRSSVATAHPTAVMTAFVYFLFVVLFSFSFLLLVVDHVPRIWFGLREYFWLCAGTGALKVCWSNIIAQVKGNINGGFHSVTRTLRHTLL